MVGAAAAAAGCAVMGNAVWLLRRAHTVGGLSGINGMNGMSGCFGAVWERNEQISG
jgi:hypothetical protein